MNVAPGGKWEFTDEPLRVSCWCEEEMVRVDRALIGQRTYPCSALHCRRMNAEYERGKA